MDSKERFSSRASDYAKFRPTYPRDIIAAILQGFDAPIVADIGAGTGISSRLLAECGAAEVFAIEPNEPMRGQIGNHARVFPVDGSAEATTLRDESVDVVTAFQAYHWFKPDLFFPEIARIVRPRARFAAVWNHRDRDDSFTGEYEAVIDTYDLTKGKVDRERRAGTPTEIIEQYGWRGVRLVEARHAQRLNRDAIIGFARSVSYVPHEGDAYDAMVAELLSIFDRNAGNGDQQFVWLTQAYLADRQ